MVYVFLANGFEEIEALGFVDILRRAEIAVKTVSINENNAVCGSHGINVIADVLLNQIEKDNLEAVVLPGGMPGTLNLYENLKVREILELAVKNNKYVGAICAAPMILGQLGYLKSKKATCYPGFEDKLIEAETTCERVVKDGIFITSRGAGTVQDFAHCFIATLKDEDTADNIISAMQY